MKLNLTFLIIGILLFSNTAHSQEYSPLKPGLVKTFKMNNSSYKRQILKEKVSKEGQEYFQSLTKYSWGEETTILLRIDDEGNEIYLDPISRTESINFPKDISLGNSWISTDGAWKYEVYKLGATLKTPKKYYTDCLVIKAEQLTNRDTQKLSLYFNYYVNQIGYVGSKNSKGLMSWLVKSKMK